MSAADILADLPELEWRGLTAPCELNPYDIKHNQAPRQYPYVNGAAHEWTGREPIALTARLFFLNTLLGASGNFHYPQNWLRWRDAIMDGTMGRLAHPDLGEFDARVVSSHVDMNAHVRSGAIVDVNWVETLEDATTSIIFAKPPIDASATVETAAAGAAAAKIKYPDGVGETNLLDAWSSIKGQIGSASLAVTGAISQMQGQVRALHADIEALNDVELNPVTSALTHLWTILEDKKEALTRSVSKSVRTRIETHDTSITSIASDTNNKVSEIMNLNPGLLRSPRVPKGSKVSFYSGKSVNTAMGSMTV